MKYEVHERPLTKQEIAELSRECEKLRAQAKHQPKSSVARILIALCIAALLSSPALWIDITPIVALALFAIIGLSAWGALEWIAARFRQNLLNLANRYDRATHGGKARTQHVKAHRVIEVQEAKQEGKCYYFEIADNQLMQIAGTWLYAFENFPTAKFEVTRLLSSDGEEVRLNLQTHGKTHPPDFVIAADDPLKKHLPVAEEIIECRFEDFVTTMRQRFFRR